METEVELDSYVLQGISEVRKKVEEITRTTSSSVIVEKDKIVIVVYFGIPTRNKEDVLSADRLRTFQKLVNEVSKDYLFSGKANRIIIERGKSQDSGRLLIEFHPPSNIYKK